MYKEKYIHKQSFSSVWLEVVEKDLSDMKTKQQGRNVSQYYYYTHTHTTVLRLCGICPGHTTTTTTLVFLDNLGKPASERQYHSRF